MSSVVSTVIHALLGLALLVAVVSTVPDVSEGKNPTLVIFLLFVVTIYAWNKRERAVIAAVVAAVVLLAWAYFFKEKLLFPTKSNIQDNGTSAAGLFKEGYEKSASLASKDFVEYSERTGRPVATHVRDFVFSNPAQGSIPAAKVYPSGMKVLTTRQKRALERGKPVAANTFSTICPLDRSSGPGSCGGTDYSGIADPLLVK